MDAFRVLGVLETKGQSGWGQDQNDIIIIPYTTAQHKLKGISWIDEAHFSVDDAQNIPSRKLLSRHLRQRHHLRADADDNFNIRHPEDILQAQEQTSETSH